MYLTVEDALGFAVADVWAGGKCWPDCLSQLCPLPGLMLVQACYCLGMSRPLGQSGAEAEDSP